MTATQGQVAIDNVFIERCGVSPPQVDVLLGDNFDDGVNALDVPSSSSCPLPT
ncbi:MAG: hypothetical protein R3B07_32645 [Polyangiaceae bacterium]